MGVVDIQIDNYLFKPSGISTESNLIKFENHGFKNGELIEYNGNISGL